MPNSPLIFRFATVYSYFNIQMCSDLMLEIKSFISLRNESFVDEGTFQGRGGELSFQI